MRVLRAMPLLTVDDLDATLNAYAIVTGMYVIMNHGWIATLAPGDGDSSVQFSLITKDASAPVNPAASIEVDNVDAYEIAVGAGVEIIYELSDEEWGVRRFFFKDAAGNVVNVLSHL